MLGVLCSGTFLGGRCNPSAAEAFVAGTHKPPLEPPEVRAALEPELSTGAVSFVVLSHIYPVLFDGDQSDIEILLREIEKCAPDVLILPGDIIPGNWNVREPGPKTFASDDELRNALYRQWDTVFETFDALGLPVWICPGNHDITSATPRYRDIVRDVYTTRVGQAFHKQQLGNYRFLFLNTALAEWQNERVEAGLDSTQIQWLTHELESSSPTVDFLFLHHALWYAALRTNPSNARGDKMAPIDWMRTVHSLLVGKVGFVFAGDGGQYGNHLFYEIRDDVHYYVNGSGAHGLSFLHVTAQGDRIVVNPHFLQIEPRVRGGSSSLRARASRVSRHPYFWLGIAVGLSFTAAAILISKLALKSSRRRLQSR